MNKKKIIISSVIVIVLLIIGYVYHNLSQSYVEKEYPQYIKEKKGKYWEVIYPTESKSIGINDAQGIILHHTAARKIKHALKMFTDSTYKVSAHVLIDEDGTRFILAEPTSITWHAGYSMLNGREKCNEFTIGIEFQGNTLVKPLTNDQIQSAIDYIIPVMKKYRISQNNITTHQSIRNEWLVNHPELAIEKNVKEKVDITQEEYQRFMNELNIRLDNKDK